MFGWLSGGDHEHKVEPIEGLPSPKTEEEILKVASDLLGEVTANDVLGTSKVRAESS